MADYRAVAATCGAVLRVLEASYEPERFDDRELQFQVFTARDFANPFQNPTADGISLFLYRIYPNGVSRTPAGRRGTNGEPLANRLPVELHFLLTLWAQHASFEHTVAGWMMRTLESTPLLPATILNAANPETFRSDETVEIALAELRTEDLLRIWEVMGVHAYRLSVPYQARVIHLDALHPLRLPDEPAVQRRTHQAGLLEPAAEMQGRP